MKYKQNCLHLRMLILKPTKLCHNCFKPHQNMGLYCVQCDKSNKTMKYEKEIKQFIGSEVKYDTCGGGYLWGQHKEGAEMIAEVVVDVDKLAYEGKEPETPVVSLRGWGAIQHLFTTTEEQEQFQDELGIFIQDAINEKLKSI